ncbi:hypothetical protein Tco_1201214 [Tanacetum coccineum]
MRGKRLLYHREYSDDAHALSRNCAALVKWISINYLYNLDFPRHFISFGYISKHHQKQSEFKLLFVPQTNLQSTSNVFKSFFATGLYGTLIVLEVKTAEKGIVRESDTLVHTYNTVINAPHGIRDLKPRLFLDLKALGREAYHEGLPWTLLYRLISESRAVEKL